MAAEGASGGPILVGWDGSEHARDALELARMLGTAMRAQLVVATVTADRLGVLRHTRGEQALIEEAEERLASLPIGDLQGMQVRTRPRVHRSPGHGLHDLAEELPAEMIVLGSTHRGALGRVFLGTVADDLLHGAPCAVAVAPRGYATRYANRLLRILAVAFDASPESEAAVRFAGGLARAAGAALHVIAVLEPLPPQVVAEAGMAHVDLVEGEQRYLHEHVERVLASLPDSLQSEGRVVSGDAADTLVEETRDGVDLLVMGSRGYGPLGRALLGSVSSRLVRMSACPVLVVPREDA